MQHAAMALVAAMVLAAAMPAAAVTPVQKVIQMLNGMLEKGKQDKHAEQVQFAAYNQFCTDTQQEKTRAVQVADEQIQMLQANIQMANTAAGDLQREIQTHDEEIATWQGDSKAATQIREIERADYVRAHEDYSETLEAIGKAIEIIKAKAYDTAQAPAGSAALAQLGASQLLPQAAKRVLAAFLAQDPLTGPENEADAYEFRSGGIVDMLGKLKDKFVEERSSLEKEELNRRHAYELLAEDLKRSVANAEDSRSAKTQQRAKRLQSAAQMQADLADTTSTRADDAKYLSDITATCKQKSGDYEERQRLRADELQALAKAIELLSSDKVQLAAAKVLLQLPGPRAATALLQLGSAGLRPDQLRAAVFLDERAARLGSRVLSALALRTREDPFDKVKKMLRDLIDRLQDAAGEEAQHEAWCRGELLQNEAVRTSRSVSVERLMSEIDGKKSSIAKLAAEVGELFEELAAADKAAQEQTTIRTAEKEMNEQTVKDAQEAQTAVGQAVTVLKEFYAMAAQSTAFVQRRGGQPEIFEGAYQGMASENGGVLAMLEVIQSDFARLESETSAAEATAQQEYNRLATESAVLKAQMKKDIEHKSILKQSDEQALVDLTNDLNSAQKELAAAQAYFEKLKPSCVDSGVTFEERARRRQEEIASLQDALRILNGEDISMA